VTILSFLAVTLGAGAASLLVGRNPRASLVIGVAGLVGAVILATGLPSEASVRIGGGELVSTSFLRLFALLGSVVALLLTVLGLATTSHRHSPGVLLGGLGAAVLALALADARIAVIAATAGGLVGVLVTVIAPPTARSVVVAGRELRALAVAGLLAILATAWIARPLGDLAGQPEVFGLAYLGFAISVAIRFGAIPFHFWAARLADAAPEITLPMLMAWGPAAFAVVALTWTDQSVSPLYADQSGAPLLLPLTVERAVIVSIGAASVLLGSLAALIQDDLEHVVGYTIIADAGFAVLGLAALGPDAWEPARTWILVFVMVRSAFAAWAVAVRGAFGTRRITELRGWALRAPLLALGLGLIVLAGIGWPGLVAWEARGALVDLTLGQPLALVVMAGVLVQLVVYVRLAVIGVGKPAAAVVAGKSERPRWPLGVPSRPMVGRSGLERAFERGSHVISATLDVLWALPAAGRTNRVPIAALVVLALAGLAFSVSAGGLGVPEAARAVPGEITGPSESGAPGASEEPIETEPGGSGEPSFQPLPTE
jgi:formate hydrogenlyase subunit 3/multisubunit Na+/H+ antiporter MnhD subunit